MIHQDIRQATLTNLATLLPTYNEITNVFDIEENTDRELIKGYVVRWGEGSPASSHCRTVGFNHTLSIILTNAVNVRESDNNAPLADTLYNDIETIVTNFLNDQLLGIPDKIRGLKAPYVSAPKLIKGNTIVSIEITFPIDFVLNINY